MIIFKITFLLKWMIVELGCQNLVEKTFLLNNFTNNF